MATTAFLSVLYQATRVAIYWWARRLTPIINYVGGEGGIRTHGPRERTPVFKTGALDHSATSPRKIVQYLSE